MKKRGFTIVEIAIAIFLLVMIASILIPMNISNRTQAQRVVKWKNTYGEIVYSLTLLAAKNPEILQIAKSETITPTQEAMNILKPYLNIDEQKSNPEYFKNYKYKFLNGKKVSPNSDFYVRTFVTLESGVIIGFKSVDAAPDEHGDHKAVMLFDVNGLEKPNRIGKDIFGVYLYSDAIKPFGEDSSLAALKTNCSPIGTGVLCSKYYLIGSAF